MSTAEEEEERHSSSSGVISLSLEESNKLRASLGLRLLSSNASSEDKTKPQEKQEDTESIIKQRLKESKFRRARLELVSGPTLTEDDDDDNTALNPLEWVNKMRELEKRPKTQNTEEEEEKDEEDEGSGVENLLMAHETEDIKKMTKNDSVILTLRDRQLITEEGELDDFVDILENEELKKIDLNKKRQLERKEGTPDLPSRYDEWAIDSKMVKKPKDYDLKGTVPLKSLLDPEEEEDKKLGGISLAQNIEFQKDYLTPDEQTRLIRKKNFKKKKKPSALRSEQLESSLDQITVNPVVRVPPAPEDDEARGESEVYEHLVIRRRPSSLLRPEKESELPAPRLDSILEEIKALKEEESPAEVKKEEEKKEKIIELTDTTEFCRSLQLPTPETRPRAAWRQEAERQEEEKTILEQDDVELSSEEEAEEDHDEVLDVLKSEELLSDGLSSALRVLKAKGELTDDAWRVGRHKKDNTPLHTSTKEGDVKIEYRDEFGRVLAPKEAFRYISWAFHGKGPGKKKREALLKKIETEKKRKAIASNVHLLPTMQALKKQQTSAGQAHLFLSASSYVCTSTTTASLSSFSPSSTAAVAIRGKEQSQQRTKEKNEEGGGEEDIQQEPELFGLVKFIFDMIDRCKKHFDPPPSPPCCCGACGIPVVPYWM